MATDISGLVSLTYGSHSHTESFSTTTATLTDANPFNEYVAGSGRALVGGAALDVGTINATPKKVLLLIKNDSNFSDLSVTVDASAYDIIIPPKVANLISVGPDHAISVKCNLANTLHGVSTVNASGAITFDPPNGTGALIGTAIMTKASGTYYPDDLVVEIDTTLTGTVYELDGATKKNLTGAGVAGYDASTTVNLVYFAQYRYTLTEA